MGRPLGSPNKDKPFRDAIRMEYLALEKGEKIEHPAGSLRAIAQAALLKASGGDTPTMNLVGDRLDGKPAQAIIGGDEEDPAVQLDTRDLSRAILEVLRSGVNKEPTP